MPQGDLNVCNYLTRGHKEDVSLCPWKHSKPSWTGSLDNLLQLTLLKRRGWAIQSPAAPTSTMLGFCNFLWRVQRHRLKKKVYRNQLFLHRQLILSCKFTSINSNSNPGSITMTTSYSKAFLPGMDPRKESLIAHAPSIASSIPGFFHPELALIQPVRNTPSES